MVRFFISIVFLVMSSCRSILWLTPDRQQSRQAAKKNWQNIIISQLAYLQKSTFLRSIWDHPSQLNTFPGLIYNLVSKHLSPSMATYQWYMIRKQANTNSTRINRQDILDTRNMFRTCSQPRKYAQQPRKVSSSLQCCGGQSPIHSTQT